MKNMSFQSKNAHLRITLSPLACKELLVPSEVGNLATFPRELHFNILTFLRATDLSALQRTCCCFNNRELIFEVVDHAANVVYGSELTKGFDTPIVSGEVESIAVVSRKDNRKGNSATIDAEENPNDCDDSLQKVYTFEMLRNMEMLVVARILSRPEPQIHERDTCFYVSKSWCRAALRWLEVQEEERKEKLERQREALVTAEMVLNSPKAMGKGKNRGHPGSSGKKKKLSRKEQRQRERRLSDVMPPWSNINHDIICEHGDLKQVSGKSARARRRIMDKQAWKVLKRLYPDSVQLEASVGDSGCLMCAAEVETAKKAEADKKEAEKIERKKPLACPLVRGFYSRGNKGYPFSSILPPQPVPVSLRNIEKFFDESKSLKPIPCSLRNCCPLKPGVYCALPRSWCHRWRKFIKTGEGGFPPAPDGSEMLCEAHNLPLVPPHLTAFLCGEASTLLGVNNTQISLDVSDNGEGVESMSRFSLRASSISDSDVLQALRSAGISEREVHAQRVAMTRLEEESQNSWTSPLRERSGSEVDRLVTNEQLDRENRVVVEILTDEEVTALESFWPHVHGTYGIRFAVVECAPKDCTSDSLTEILWHTLPCRECDPSSMSTSDFLERNRLQKRGYR